MLKNIRADETSKTLNIRAHHLLCIQGFQGHGYSPEFTIKLAEIIRQIHNPKIRIRVIDEPDSICFHCPNLFNGECSAYPEAEHRVREMDQLVLQKMKLRCGEIADAAILLSRATDWESTLVKRICGSCSWKDRCSWYQKEIHF